MNLEDYRAQQIACDNACDITELVVEQANLMKCVTCPFCKATVDAILTEKTIACPKCKVKVSRG